MAETKLPGGEHMTILLAQMSDLPLVAVLDSHIPLDRLEK